MAVTTSDRVHDGRVARRRRTTRFFGPGVILGAIGAGGVIASMFLPWRDSGVYPSDIPVEFLWNRGATSDPSLLIVLVPLAVMLAVGALVPTGAGLRLFGAVCTLGVAGVFAYQLHRVVHAFGGNFGDALDTGFYVALLGGILAFVSGLVPSYARTREEREELVRSDATGVDG